MLSGAMASEMRRHIAGDQATIAIWVGDAETGLRRMTFSPIPSTAVAMGNGKFS